MNSKRKSRILIALSFIILLGVPSYPVRGLTVGSNVNVIQTGSLNTGDQNKLQQNEPTIAIDPTDSNILVSGANDYRRSRFVTPASVWMGYYRSTDAGASWTNSLIPGFPGDSSSAGLASPVHGLGGASDPVVAFDSSGNAYFSMIAFNSAGFPDTPGPLQENGVFVAKYTNDGATYSFTSKVSFNPASLGIFDDKEWIAVDTGSSSSFQGNVYTCWTRFIGFSVPAQGLFGGNRIMFSASTDGGVTYSNPQIVSDRGREGSILNQDCQISVAPDGKVYVAWVTFGSGSNWQPTPDGISIVKSTDGGAHFSKPTTAVTYSPVPRNNGASDCCGVFAWRTARTFGLAVDTNGVIYMAYMGDNDPAANFDSSGNIVLSNVDSDVYVGKSTNGGSSFTVTDITANNVQSGSDGNEVFPSIATAGTRVDIAYYTNVNDPNPSDDNQPSLATNVGGPGPEAITDVYYSYSTDGGNTWSSVKVTDSVGDQRNTSWPMFRSGTLAFHGDYLGIASVGNTIHIIWTDDRDVSFIDPNTSTPSVEADSSGNRDQNIYTSTVTL